MCQYDTLDVISNYGLLTSIPVVIVAAIILVLTAIAARDRNIKRSAQVAAASLLIPIAIIIFSVIPVYINAMAHQANNPGLAFHLVTAVLGSLSLATSIGCPIAGWFFAKQR